MFTSLFLLRERANPSLTSGYEPDELPSKLIARRRTKTRYKKSTYPKISAAVAVCGRKHITSKVLLSFVLNASFIFFKLIYNIIDFGAIVKGVM